MINKEYKEYMDEISKLPNFNVIYCLCDPITNDIRYVGKATCLYIRIRKHHNQSKLIKPNHKNNWIKSLLNKGLRAKVIVIEECYNEEDLNDAEIKWIKHYKNLGYNLTNGTEGGDGGKLSPESIAKMAASKKGKKLSEEHKAKISKANMGHKPYNFGPLTEEHKAKISKANKGKFVSEETREKLSKANKGKFVSDETRIKQKNSRLSYLNKTKNQ